MFIRPEGSVVFRFSNVPTTWRLYKRTTKRRTEVCVSAVEIREPVTVFALTARWNNKERKIENARVVIRKNKEIVSQSYFKRYYHPRVIPVIFAGKRDLIELEVTTADGTRVTDLPYTLYIHCKPRKKTTDAPAQP